MFGIINVLFLKIDFIHAIYEKLTENFKVVWKTRIFDHSMTAALTEINLEHIGI